MHNRKMDFSFTRITSRKQGGKLKFGGQGPQPMRHERWAIVLHPLGPSTISCHENWYLRGCPRGQCMRGRFGIVTPLGTARFRFPDSQIGIWLVAPHHDKGCHCEPVTDVTGVAIRSPFGIFVIKTCKGMRIATPVCALARNDIRVF